MLEGKDEKFKTRFDRFAKLRFARLCAYLRQREPDDHVGHSMLIYRLSKEQIAEALEGAPPEGG